MGSLKWSRHTGLSAVIALVGVSAAAAAGPGSPSTIATLRGQSSVLASRTHHALLDLYALDAHLTSARARLASLQTQAAQLRNDQLLLAEQLGVTKTNLAVSQQLLGRNLRLLYEQGQQDPLAVVLGATSLDDAVTKLDDLTHVADASKQMVDATTAAHERIAQLRATIAAESAQIDTALRSAQTTTNELAATRAARVGFISNLRRQQQLKASQIATLQTIAQQAEAKSQAIQASTVGAPTDPSGTTSSTAPTPPPVGSRRTITVSSTGYSLPGHTATGLPVGWGVVAVDPSVIPLGTRMTIPGYGEGVAADTGSAVRGYDVDLWFPTLAQARAWGRRTVTITLH
ncbi:MAG TPA: 3D domain-containing protein [Gaiellaceae bacterium]|nr:3D domain-containing protein [Gaiellaceae bacterium]